MKSLTASEILGIWEQGLAQSPVDCAIAILAAAYPESSPNMLAKLAIGERDSILLSLQEQTFGPAMVCLATCPSCGERLEVTLNVEDIQARPYGHSDKLEVSAKGLSIQFRLPNSLDLMAIVGYDDVPAARQVLLERCLVGISDMGEEEFIASNLPSDIKETIAEKMAEADPQANVQLALLCPACRHEWQAVFDIVSFLWNEIDAWSRRILHDVHVLASAYGWSEADILAMNPRRRQTYLDMVNQ